MGENREELTVTDWLILFWIMGLIFALVIIAFILSYEWLILSIRGV